MAHIASMFRLVAVVCLAMLLVACAASDKIFATMEKNTHDTADKLPDWLTGKPPPEVPPKPTDPGYVAYKAKVEGKAPPGQPSAN